MLYASICDPPRIYPSLPQSTPPFIVIMWGVFGYHNLPVPSHNIPPFIHLYSTLPEYTPPSNDLPPPPFSWLCEVSSDTRIYPFLPQYTTFKHLFATLPEYTLPSQNLPPFPLLYATLPESTPPSQYIPLLNSIFDPPRIYPSLPRSTPSLFRDYVRCLRIPKSTPSSHAQYTYF